MIDLRRYGFDEQYQQTYDMGWCGSPTGELLFDDCRVPAENLIGAQELLK